MRRPGIPERAARSRWSPIALLALAAVSLALAFALYTHQAWEDFYISYRHSENWVSGHGLSFRADARVQGFTSPLAVAALSGARALVGPDSPEAALRWFRIPSVAAYAGALAGLLLALRTAGPRAGPAGVCAASALFLLEPKAAAFSVNGMETGFVLFFLAGCLWVLARGVRGRWLPLGACWAGLLFARPDGCVAITAFAAAVLLFADAPRRALLGELARAAALCAALYAPWFAGAWAYYGSPLPLPVLAKGLSAAPAAPPLAWLASLFQTLGALFLRPYAAPVQPDPMAAAGLVLSAVGVASWAWPRAPRFARQSSFMAACGVLYLALLPRRYPWYYPGPWLLCLPAWAALADAAWRRTRGLPRLALAGAGGLLALVLAFAWVDYARHARAVQQVIETGHRQRIGAFLRETARPGDRVFTEAAGYFGYYSGLPILDYPGVVAPEVVRVRRTLGDDPSRVVRELRPEWLVLRPRDASFLLEHAGDLLDQEYRVVRSFDATRAWTEHTGGGRPPHADSRFFVLRRDGAASGPAGPTP